MIEWFDDLTLGMRFKSGEVSVSREDIKRFAAEFDPQPFHLDEAAAEKTVFKGLAASGWHTAAISMGLTVEVTDCPTFYVFCATSPQSPNEPPQALRIPTIAAGDSD